MKWTKYSIRLFLKFFLLIGLLFFSTILQAENYNYLLKEIAIDSVKKSPERKEKKQEKKDKKIKQKKEAIQEMKDSHSRFILKIDNVFASLDTRVTFKGPYRIVNLSFGLEDNLGLPSSRYFLASSFMYRITPRHGIYAEYYGINRKEDYTIKNEIYYLEDTIPVGTATSAYFNTQVISAGYMVSALKDPNAYLGFYFNLYVMAIKTGVSAEIGNVSGDLGLAVPLPNIGVVGMFKLTKWLNFNTTVGVFSLNTKEFGGNIFSLDVSLLFKPVHWMGIGLSYRKFDVSVYFIEYGIDTVIDYNFNGPSLGLTFIF